jgi:hypothetical protein
MTPRIALPIQTAISMQTMTSSRSNRGCDALILLEAGGSEVDTTVGVFMNAADAAARWSGVFTQP